MLPLLIVCFLRPADLEAMLEQHVGSKRRLYVFVDKSGSWEKDTNNQVIAIANKYLDLIDLRINIAEKNYGVAVAVPEAINWISLHEEKFIILEDDCHLNSNGFVFIENHISKLSNEISVVSATSPWDISEDSGRLGVNTLSRYPLISGWATSKSHWQEISFLIGRKIPFFLSLQAILRNPKNIFGIAYFLSAHIRVYRGKSEAWDCSMALAMLILNKKSLIPSITMVTNTGRDRVAQHTLPIGNQDRFFRLASHENPSVMTDMSKEYQNLTNQKIEKEFYGLRKRHLLSPFKALFF